MLWHRLSVRLERSSELLSPPFPRLWQSYFICARGLRSYGLVSTLLTPQCFFLPAPVSFPLYRSRSQCFSYRISIVISPYFPGPTLYLFLKRYTTTPAPHISGVYPMSWIQLYTIVITAIHPCPSYFMNAFTIASAPAAVLFSSCTTHSFYFLSGESSLRVF